MQFSHIYDKYHYHMVRPSYITLPKTLNSLHLHCNQEDDMAKMPLVHIAIFAILCAVWIPFDVNCKTSSTEDARLDEIEAILQSVVRKNQELEIKMGHMEIELEAQKKLNSELKRRIEDLENEQQPIEDINIDTDSEDSLSGDIIRIYEP